MARIDDLRTRLDDKFDNSAFIPGDDKKYLDVVKVPSGLIELDIALGGGIPVGRTTMVYGPKSTGKSTLCELIVAAFQKRCCQCWGVGCDCEMDEDANIPTVMWVDLEGTYTYAHAQEMGINASSMLVTLPESGEGAADSIKEAVESSLCDLIVVDSLALMTPAAEVARDMTESPNARVGSQAKLVAEFLRQLQMTQNKVRKENGTAATVIIVNQQREKISTFGPQGGKINTGGLSVGYATSVEIEISSSKVNFDRDKQRNVVGVSYAETFFKIAKSKVSTPQFTGRFRIWVHPDKDHAFGETDEVDKVVKIAIQEKIVDKQASKLLYQGVDYKTQKKLKQTLNEDYELFAAMRAEILDKLVWKPTSSLAAKEVLAKLEEEAETINPLAELTAEKAEGDDKKPEEKK